MRSRRVTPSLWFVGAALIPVVLVALPLLYVVIRASQAGVSGIWSELFRERTFTLLVNTLVLATSVTAASIFIGVSVAWCVERSDLPGRHWLRIVAALPLAVPAFVSSYAWSSIDVAFQSLAGAIMVLTLSSYPLVYLPVAAALRGMDSNFEDVSRSLGHGAWRTFTSAMLPQLLPALGGGALLVLSHMLAEFGALALLRVQTFTTAIFESYELQFDSFSAALQSGVLMVLCLPPAYLEMRLRAGRRVARVGRGSARHPSPVKLGHRASYVMVALMALGALALAVPLATLGYWLVQGQSAGRGYTDVWRAITGTASFSVFGALLTGILAVPLVWLSVRHRGGLAVLAERLPYVAHGLPGVVVALALVFMSIQLVPSLYQTTVLLLLAYVILFLPLAQSSLRASMELASPQFENIARSLGRRPLHAFLSVTLPMIAPGVGAALALVMLEIVRELTATLMLAPTGAITLATEVWSHTSNAEYAAAAPFAALLVAFSVLPVYVFTRRLLRYGEAQ